ncbi:hypothetical protein PUNSTDRAFT_121248 [Punctularia strigosozonata HHB-11173 SS5]|uniref:uncharacterized protein n=1 Tax=Punctularia strigosozonata (strain HHB-11173) TaxID=741275 RepID=UPI0004416C9A|nr:uncharacterized protein PUNSTDRAFT_121248 [Punctularia strigosozonata HHB-11173 SS5]EIN07009.1 hypothetical protein PUNSTDRAFT_121248 [Punctularia strigosozonata HHB-11173 SS5]
MTSAVATSPPGSRSSSLYNELEEHQEIDSAPHLSSVNSIDNETSQTRVKNKWTPLFRRRTKPSEPRVHFPFPVTETDEDVKVEREKWKSGKQLFLESCRADRERRPIQDRLVSDSLIVNSVLHERDMIPRREQRLRLLAKVKGAHPSIRVGVDELETFWREQKPRWEAFALRMQSLPVANYLQKSTEATVTEHEWVTDMWQWIDVSLDDLEQTWANQEEYRDSPPLIPTSLPQIVASSVGETLRGADATSNTAAREWITRGQNMPRNPLLRSATVGRPWSEAFGMSTAASYTTNFTTLGAVAFFGASISWSAVFSGQRGDLVLIAWSAAVFVAASVAAGGMGIIVGSEGINIDRDMGARRFVRGFAVCSALMLLTGIVLLSLAMAGIQPTYALPNDDGQPSAARRRVMSAAGWFTIGAVGVETLLAVCVRVMYSTTSYHW